MGDRITVNEISTTPLKRIPVIGGDVLHAMKKTDHGFSGFGESYFSQIESGVVKAWKKHSKMTLNLIVPIGRVRFVFKDNDGLFREEIIGDDNYVRLTIPPGIWFGFKGDFENTSLILNIANIEPFSQAIALDKPVDVARLPGFEQGWVSVQDAAAQQAAYLLDCQPNDRVLDCCAAPGGKTCHIIEKMPSIASLVAIDIEENRLLRVHENLTRLNLTAQVITADAAKKEWWDGEQFDRILLDAPCSGTGVIRRHPDIKWLRKADDITQLITLQREILANIWSLLKPGGTLLYATCSVLPEENSQQINAFLLEHNDAELITLDTHPLNTIKEQIGWQLLPDTNNMDGFYYAKLLKIKQKSRSSL